MTSDKETHGESGTAPSQDESVSTSSASTPVLVSTAATHIALADGTETVPNTEPEDGQGPLASPSLRNSKGWDGKLRLPKKTAVLANPEALSDPEYSDEDNVVPGETISADEDILDGEDPETDEIFCTHSRVRSIDALHLERFTCCQRLCLRQNSIQRLDSPDATPGQGLAALAGCLKELDMYDNLIAHMRGVETLPGLTSLDLSFNKIKHIKHLAGLRELTDLFLVANKIGKIEGLETLTRMRMLELGSNRIREIRGLDGLVALEELWLAKNKITDLSGLDGLPRLRLLSLQSNRISDLSPLRVVSTLEELYLSHNLLESVASLSVDETKTSETDGKASDDKTAATSILPNLRTLDIGNNKITSLQGIGGLHKLEELWASYNLLNDFTDVERNMADKSSLETVYFEGNPLQLRAPALYRNKVRLVLPQVKQIDATYVR
ncbi:protein phosphatase pp1 regulatory subunit [Grosmannia clavigera kw1407]|uniref:Protein phosphatase pp1 regulatory subunit n=1 Tax=Grosmannia clavigera (strain kw1407 / UAMH 11150) TaxID=655863 RepID=F0XN51_GROCL|nr:protein phosphatase pp1 regulatory subunit [Grosmannia clavigera kw1407]EFX00842.1 protein phosphatase pp1 regulatory subunit [Grosmannia clavigera kw1407]